MEDNNKITNGDVTADRLKNLKPLKVTDDMTEEERQRQHEIRSKGGKARALQIEKQKTLKELANQLLNTKVSKERAKNVLGELANDIPDGDLTNGALLLARMLNEVYENGTTKAAEYLRDTSGQKPKEEISLTADIMTDSDRALMANIAERLSATPDSKNPSKCTGI